MHSLTSFAIITFFVLRFLNKFRLVLLVHTLKSLVDIFSQSYHIVSWSHTDSFSSLKAVFLLLLLTLPITSKGEYVYKCHLAETYLSVNHEGSDT